MDTTDQPQQGQTSRRHQLGQRPVVLVVALLGVALLVHQFAGTDAPVTLKRYVSAPLPDGSRMTFLYPSDLQVRSIPGAPHVTYVSSRGLYWENLARLRLPWGGDREVIHAWCEQPSALKGVPRFDSLSRDDLSLDGMLGRQPRSYSARYIAFHDAKWHIWYRLDHVCQSKDRFTLYDAKIIDSFAVLPPGAPVPKP